MPFGLFQAGDAAEEVFHPGGHHGQAMGFELGAVDDVVGLKHGRDQCEAVAPPAGNVQVEMQKPLKRRKATGRIELFEHGRAVNAAGAVRKGDF